MSQSNNQTPNTILMDGDAQVERFFQALKSFGIRNPEDKNNGHVEVVVVPGEGALVEATSFVASLYIDEFLKEELIQKEARRQAVLSAQRRRENLGAWCLPGTSRGFGQFGRRR